MSIEGQGLAFETAFAPIHSGAGLSDLVARRIADVIAMGLIADGEQLPPEDRLSAQFNVSTVTLRGALEILRQQGLVRTRRGRGGGSFALAPRSATRGQMLRRLNRLSTTELRDLADEQTAVAGFSARLAARRAVSGNIARLDGLAEKLRLSRSDIDAAQADSRFHVEVAVSSQSERLTRQEVGLQAEYMDLVWMPGHGRDRGECADQHAAIAAAIRAEDEHLARDLAEEHAAGNFRFLIDQRLRMTT